jgi:hypothetical protein
VESGAPAGKLTKDADDFSLQLLSMEDIALEAYNTFFKDTATPVNNLVSRNNELNDVITALKSAVALATGALLVEARAAKDTDTVTYDILKAADGKAPLQEDATKLASDKTVYDADKAVAVALKKLHDGLEAATAHAPLALTAGKLTSTTDAAEVKALIDGVDKAVSALKAALGGTYLVELRLKPASSAGSEVAKAEIVATRWEDEDAEEPSKTPASCLDILKYKAADKVLRARSTLQLQLDGYTSVSKGVADHKLQV